MNTAAASAADAALVEVRGLRTVLSGKTIFDGLELDVPRGRITAIMGPSGTGKTTLLRHITGQLAPDAGTIRVDGQPLDMLLDTGATAHPTPAGKKASGTPTVNGLGVTSYITASVFNRWHKAHPDWRVVGDGDDLGGPKHPMPIIEVPEVEIAGWSVGPVWFTERPDPAFHDMMSSMMDKRIEGAVGGNVFRRFVMTIDYPQATAYFRCVRGCKPAATPPPGP